MSSIAAIQTIDHYRCMPVTCRLWGKVHTLSLRRPLFGCLLSLFPLACNQDQCQAPTVNSSDLLPVIFICSTRLGLIAWAGVEFDSRVSMGDRSSWVSLGEGMKHERAIKLTLPFSVRLRLNSTGALDWDSTIRECRGSRNSDRWRGSFDLLVQCSAMQEQGGSGGSGD